MKNMNVMLRLIGIFITFSRREIRPACTVIKGGCVFYSGEIEVLYYDYLTVTAEDITNTSVVPPTASNSSLGAGHSEWHADDPSSWPSSPPTKKSNPPACFNIEMR